MKEDEIFHFGSVLKEDLDEYLQRLISTIGEFKLLPFYNQDIDTLTLFTENTRSYAEQLGQLTFFHAEHDDRLVGIQIAQVTQLLVGIINLLETGKMSDFINDMIDDLKNWKS